MSADARKAALKGALGAVQSAIAIAHAQALLENKTAESGQSITLEGSTVDLVFGYPAATADGIGAAVRLTGDITFTTAGTKIGFSTGVTTAANCEISYSAATSASVPATASIVVSNCS